MLKDLSTTLAGLAEYQKAKAWDALGLKEFMILDANRTALRAKADSLQGAGGDIAWTAGELLIRLCIVLDALCTMPD